LAIRTPIPRAGLRLYPWRRGRPCRGHGSYSRITARAFIAQSLSETFSFSGTIDFPADTTAPRGDRVVAAEILPARLARLTERAAAAGVALTAPAAGDVLAAGVLRLHAFRIGGTLQAADSAGFAPIREFLEAERHDRSPLGIRRITVENRAGRHLVFIDIMAFTP